MRQRYLWIGLVVLACALIWSACGGRQAGPSGPGGAIAGRAPDFTVSMLDGSTVQLSKLVGKPVVVHFWGTW